MELTRLRVLLVVLYLQYACGTKVVKELSEDKIAERSRSWISSNEKGLKGKDLRTLLGEIGEILNSKHRIGEVNERPAADVTGVRPTEKATEKYRNRSDKMGGDESTLTIPTSGTNGMVVELNGGKEKKPIVLSNQQDPLNILSKQADDEILDNDSFRYDKRKKRNLVALDSRWPKGKVPYTIDETKITKPEDIEIIKTAIEIMKNLTCVQFLPMSDELLEDVGHDNYVTFTVIRGCTSHVGMSIPGQGISLDSGCMNLMVIFHEMLHAIGFSHEQDRSDRDYYIKMLGSWSQRASYNTINYAPYDLQSVMQYSLQVYVGYTVGNAVIPSGLVSNSISNIYMSEPQNTFGNETLMDVIDQNQKFLISSRKPNTLQYYDVQDIISMYGCAASCNGTPACQHGSFLNHMCECYCPDHLTGTTCESIITDEGCGGIFDVGVGQEVQLQTPNFPQPYPVDKTCRWLFMGKKGYHLRITIDDMHLPYNNLDTCYHWIEVHYNNIGQPGVKRCGQAAGLTFTTSRDSPELLMVGFDSKTNPSRTPEKGFSYRVYLVGDHCLNNPCNFGTCNETGSGYECKCESGFSGQHCDQMQDGQIFACNFDYDVPCIFVNTASGDQFDWTISKYTTYDQGIGPSYARTGDGFLVADMSSQGTQETAYFITAFPLKAEDRCLSFYYSMNGQYVSSLRVKSKSIQSPSFSTIWSKHSDQGPNWHHGQVFLTAEQNLELLFEASKGNINSSVIALDNITLTPGLCHLDNSSDDVVHLTTVKWTQLNLVDFGMRFSGIGWINFEVHGCNGAIVELQTETKSSDDSYKLALGQNDNYWVYLSKYEKGDKTKSSYKFEPTMNCDKYEPYWLGWKDNKMQLGRGYIYGENVVFAEDDTQPHDVRYVLITSSSKTKWNFIKGNCVSGFGKCSDTGYCVIPTEICDNVHQCTDSSDEEECDFPACDDSEFRCTYGRCYPGTVACNGMKDCSDNSDELDCPIYVAPHTHIDVTDHGVSPVGTSVFKFSVKTCSDALIGLWNGDSKLYEVGLGRGGNSWSSLAKIGGSSDFAHGTLLNCANFVSFFISWSGTEIQVGRGHNVGEDVVLKLQEVSTPQIDEISIGSFQDEVYYSIEAALPPCNASEFRCGYGRCIPDTDWCDGNPHCTDGSDEKDCPIVVPKWKEKAISDHKYNISGREWLNLQVKSCGDAWVTLLQAGTGKFRVMLGRGSNTWNSLYNLDTDQDNHKFNTAVLDCDNYTSFWFSWSDGIAQVGQGLYKGQKPFLQLPYSSPVSIDDVLLESYSNENAFKIRQGNCFEGLFKCSEREECISPDLKCDGVSDCSIESGGSDEQECVYPPCDPDTEFRCGYGRCYPIGVRCDKVVDCRDKTDEFKCPIKTAPYASKVISDYGFSIEGLTWVNFKVKTCADAHILLTKDNQVMYKILLGRGDDTWSTVEKVSGIIQWKNGNILNCTDFVPFWVSWKDGQIQVGMGLNRNENTYLSLTDDSYEAVNNVQVKSWAREGEWFFEQGNCFSGLFNCSETEICIPLTEECNGHSDCAAVGGSDEQHCAPCNSSTEFQCSYGRCIPSKERCDDTENCWDKSDERNCPIVVPVLWLASYLDLEPFGITGKERDTLIFTTDACSDAWVGLMPGKTSTSSMYKIGIGRGGNTYNTIVKNGIQVEITYSIILDCTTRQMWVTWKNGRIAAGVGTDVSQNVTIEWTDSDPLVVNDIGLSSWGKTWIFQNTET